MPYKDKDKQKLAVKEGQRIQRLKARFYYPFIEFFSYLEEQHKINNSDKQVFLDKLDSEQKEHLGVE